MSLNTANITVREYPDDGGDYQTLHLRNHWNHKDRVVLRIDGEKEFTFIIEDIRKALNAVEATR